MNIYAERENLLNKDQENEKVDNKQQPIKYQQFRSGPPFGSPGQRGPGPGGPPGQRPGRPQDPPDFGPGRPQGPPGTGPGRPPSAPPTFTPQLPREEQQQLTGPSGFRGPFVGGINFRRVPRDFRGCMNRFTYIWLINGNNFWFYPVFVGRNTIEGFRWRRNRWEYDRIFTNRILFHLCF